jgi:hypothetical protein
VSPRVEGAPAPQTVVSVEALFENGKRAGVIRDDLEPGDTVAMLAMLGSIEDRPGSAERWRRYLTLLLDGARATGRPPLPGSADRYRTLDDVIADTEHRRPGHG